MARSLGSKEKVGPGFRPWAMAALCVGLGLASAPLPAHAQLFGFWPWDRPAESGIGPGEVQRILAARGMRLLTAPYRSDDVYVADVIDARGLQERLVIDAYRGSIIQRYRVGPATPRYAARGALPPWPDSGEGLFARPFGDESAPLRQAPGGLVPDVGARGPGDESAEPGVVPGIGPELPKPKVRHPAHPKAVARSTPPPKPDNTAAPENATVPSSGAAAPAGAQGGGSRPPAAAAPAPSQAEKVTPPGAPAAKPATPPPVTTARSPAAVPTPPPAKAETPPKKKSPLNDIPPAPLD